MTDNRTESEMVGVLALQGAYQKHIEILVSMGVECRLVRTAHELVECAALILPGGESTTMSLLIQQFGLYETLRDFAANKPVMGVCAGAILMADSVDDARVTSLNILPIKVERNHYGRQVHSFSADVQLSCDTQGLAYPAIFIRAPGIQPHNEKIEVLASYKDDTVMVRMGHHLAMTFHPELSGDPRVHACWLQGFHPAFQ